VIGMVWNFAHVQSLIDQSDTLVSRGLELGRENERLDAQLGELERNARQYVVVGDSNVLEIYRQRHQRLSETLAWIARLVNDAQSIDLVLSMQSAADSMFERLNAVPIPPNDETLSNEFQRLRSLSNDLSSRSTQHVRSQLESLREATRDARTVSYLGGAAALIGMILLLSLSAILITKPIRQLDKHIRRLGEGNLDEPIAIDGPDDVSSLAQQLDELRLRVIEVDSAKDQFMREMSHQLKTPLASIREGTDLLLDGSVRDTDEIQKEVIGILHQNSVELQRMLDNLLNFSAWRVQPNQLNKERFSLKLLVEGVTGRYGISIFSRRLDLQVDIPDDLFVTLDRGKMRTVVDNLVSNAVKFAPVEGRIVIAARVDINSIILDVIDDGPGIPDEDREQVFELFFRGDDPGSHLRGTGVGLALVRAYVEAHGGTIHVIPNKPGGHFRVRLPTH
jgi:two-component system, NtrC family, sensor histidine kinase GlrK